MPVVSPGSVCKEIGIALPLCPGEDKWPSLPDIVQDAWMAETQHLPLGKSRWWQGR